MHSKQFQSRGRIATWCLPASSMHSFSKPKKLTKLHHDSILPCTNGRRGNKKNLHILTEKKRARLVEMRAWIRPNHHSEHSETPSSARDRAPNPRPGHTLADREGNHPATAASAAAIAAWRSARHAGSAADSATPTPLAAANSASKLLPSLASPRPAPPRSNLWEREREDCA